MKGIGRKGETLEGDQGLTPALLCGSGVVEIWMGSHTTKQVANTTSDHQGPAVVGRERASEDKSSSSPTPPFCHRELGDS